MRAVALTEYGDPDVLTVHDLPDPLVGPDQILVEVRAAGVNPVDSKIRRGFLRGAFPHHEPLIPGWDLAGVVRAVGPAARGFVEGDEVYGYARKDHVQHGTYAELVSVSDRMVARKPATATFEEAAALPLAALTAWQALDAVGAGDGDIVLVHAAAGGVGHLAVQLALARGAARVIGTASEANFDFVRSLGADPVQYGEGLAERVAALIGGDGKADVVTDFVGGDALTVSPQLVRDVSRHVSVVDPTTALAQGGRYIFVRADQRQLERIADLVDSGAVRVEVQHAYPLQDAAAAHAVIEEGHVRGKLVLTVGA